MERIPAYENAICKAAGQKEENQTEEQTDPGKALAEHIMGMATDSYLVGHPEWQTYTT